MKFSIATVSLGGSLTEKLRAIAAAAGFEGVEIVEADVHHASPGRRNADTLSKTGTPCHTSFYMTVGMGDLPRGEGASCKSSRPTESGSTPR